MTLPAPDVAAAIEFLRWMNPDGPWSVGSIPAETDPSRLAWLTTDDLGAVESFVRAQGALGQNLYFQPAVCRPDIGGARAKKEHVIVALFAHADVDPPDSADAAALAAWQESTATTYASPEHWASLGLPPPSAIIFSGSGFQLLWRLDEPVVLWRDIDGAVMQDPALVDAVEGASYAILRLVDPAHAGTHNVDRLLRLPGTLNYPNERKRAKYGRTEPVLACGEWGDATCALAGLPHESLPVAAKAPRVEGRADPSKDYAGRVPLGVLTALLPEWLLEKVVDGAPPGEDRSVFTFATTCGLIRHLGDESVHAVLLDPAYKVSGHVLDQGDPERAAGRAVDHAHATR